MRVETLLLRCDGCPDDSWYHCRLCVYNVQMIRDTYVDYALIIVPSRPQFWD